MTYRLFFLNIREDLEEDGPPLFVEVVTGWWPATWTFVKVLLFTVFSAVCLTAGYKLVVWLFA
jgi:hypothetical protein